MRDPTFDNLEAPEYVCAAPTRLRIRAISKFSLKTTYVLTKDAVNEIFIVLRGLQFSEGSKSRHDVLLFLRPSFLGRLHLLNSCRERY